MSFQDAARGSQELRNVRRPATEAERAVGDLQRKVFSLTTDIKKLSAQVDLLGTSKDTRQLRQRIHDGSTNINSRASDIKSKLTVVAHQEERSPGVAKTASDLQDALKVYTAVMKNAKALELRPLKSIAVHEPDLEAGEASREEEEQAALMQQQQKADSRLMDNMIEHTTGIIEERDAAIQDIQNDIQDVAQIFQDLAVLVHEQGELLNDIDGNITKVGDHVLGGRSELIKAETSQKAARGKWCFLALIGAAVLFVLLLVLLS